MQKQLRRQRELHCGIFRVIIRAPCILSRWLLSRTSSPFSSPDIYILSSIDRVMGKGKLSFVDVEARLLPDSTPPSGFIFSFFFFFFFSPPSRTQFTWCSLLPTRCSFDVIRTNDQCSMLPIVRLLCRVASY